MFIHIRYICFTNTHILGRIDGNTPLYPRPFTPTLLPCPFTPALLPPTLLPPAFLPSAYLPPVLTVCFLINIQRVKEVSVCKCAFLPPAFLPPVLKYHFQSYRYGIFNVHLNIIIGFSDMTHNLTLLDMFLVPTVILHTVPDLNHKYDNRKCNI